MLRLAAMNLSRRALPRAAPFMGGGLIGSAFLLKPTPPVKCDSSDGHDALVKTLVFQCIEEDVDTSSGEVAIGKVGEGTKLHIAGTGDRIRAAGYDLALQLGVPVAVGMAIGLATASWGAGALMAAAAGCGMPLHCLVHYIKHQATPGKTKLGIKQVTVLQKKGQWVLRPVSFLVYVVNQLFRQAIAGITGGINYLVPFFDVHGQFLSDKALGIYTVQDVYWTKAE